MGWKKEVIMTKQTQRLHPLLNWVSFLFYKLSTISYELFLQNKAKFIQPNHEKQNEPKPIASSISSRTNPVLERSQGIRNPENTKQTHFGQTNPIASRTNRVYSIKNKEFGKKRQIMKLQNKANSVSINHPLLTMIYYAKQSQISSFSVKNQRLPEKQTQTSSRIPSRVRDLLISILQIEITKRTQNVGQASLLHVISTPFCRDSLILIFTLLS
jgi:hypothetical protein